MPHAHKTARIGTGGYYLPQGLSMEPEEEEPQEQEFDLPTPPTPIPTPEPVQEEPKEVEVVHLSNDDEEDIIEEDEPILPLWWTTKVWYKPGCESSVSHHRLMSML